MDRRIGPRDGPMSPFFTNYWIFRTWGTWKSQRCSFQWNFVFKFWLSLLSTPLRVARPGNLDLSSPSHAYHPGTGPGNQFICERADPHSSAEACRCDPSFSLLILCLYLQLFPPFSCFFFSQPPSSVCRFRPKLCTIVVALPKYYSRTSQYAISVERRAGTPHASPCHFFRQPQTFRRHLDQGCGSSGRRSDSFSRKVCRASITL